MKAKSTLSESKTYSIPVIASSETAQGDLKGSATENLTYDANAEYDYYMLALNSSNNVQFTKLTSGTIAAGKAYLVLDNSSINVKALNVVINDESTGIQTVQNSELKGSGEYYNLSGQRVATPQKGLYIVNGKKVLVK